MIKAIIFDFFEVLEHEGAPNKPLLTYIRTKLKPAYKIGVISNANADWFYEILSKEDAGLFDDVVLSHRAGVAKPEPAIYHRSLENLGVRAEEAVFIDDIESFCEAARSVGIQAIKYRDFNQFISELKQVLTS